MGLLEKFKGDIDRESLRFLIQKQIFCKYSGAVLDVDNAIMIDAFDKDDKLVSTSVIDGRFEHLVDKIRKSANDRGLRVEVLISKK